MPAPRQTITTLGQGPPSIFNFLLKFDDENAYNVRLEDNLCQHQE